MEGAPSLVAFMPLSQLDGWGYLHLVLRTDLPLAALTRSVGRIIREMDPGLPPPPVRTMESIVAEEVAPRKFILVLLTLFAGLAGLLATIGLYGVLAYMVTQQTREIGIRLALGAKRRKIMHHVMWQGMVLTGSGLILGLLVALLAVRLLHSMVYGVGVYDGWTFAGCLLLLSAVGMAASVIPALRASRVDPVISLQVE